MTISTWGLLALFLAALLIASWPLATGTWLARIYDGRLPSLLHRIESPIFRLAGVSEDGTASRTEKTAQRTWMQMTWSHYASAVLLFNVTGVLVVYALQRLQAGLPLNPQSMTAVSPDSAFNTAISFVSNTNWQGYSSEATMSYLTQMLALTVQNFLSAATGIAVVFALIRGFAARATGLLGNFWVDITRITIWLLVPLSLVFASVFSSQGVIQNYGGY